MDRMYPLFRNVPGSNAAPGGPTRTQEQQWAAIHPSEVDSVDFPPLTRSRLRHLAHDHQSDLATAADLAAGPSYPARMRAILIMSIAAWAVTLSAVWAIA